MRLIVGLGNPGIEYQLTPHNAGFLAVDRIAQVCGATFGNRRGRAVTAKAKLAGEDVLLAKPETFMNLSGLSVAALVRELEIAVPAESKDPGLIVIYDELAFPLGKFKLAERGSANGHNGVKSISGALGTEEWLRIRIGVGKAPLPEGPEGRPGREIKAGGRDYLLAPMRRQELMVMDEVLDRVRAAVEAILTRGVSAAMNEFNRSEL